MDVWMNRWLRWQHALRVIVRFVAIADPVVVITVDVAHHPTEVDASTWEV
jgi:hypothetical protein